MDIDVSSGAIDLEDHVSSTIEEVEATVDNILEKKSPLFGGVSFDS